MNFKLYSKIILALFVLNCVLVVAESEKTPAVSFLETKLDFSARAKDQFASDNCQTQCKKIGGFPCGNVSKACCKSQDYCKSSWASKWCTVPVHAFIC
ncbi:hypothetical protein ABPG72_019664 [Tetrahymena utriculariae]